MLLCHLIFHSAKLTQLPLPTFTVLLFLKAFEILIGLGYKEGNGISKNARTFKHLEITGGCPSQIGIAVRVSACGLKGPGVHSGQGRVPRFQA